MQTIQSYSLNFLRVDTAYLRFVKSIVYDSWNWGTFETIAALE